MTCLKVQRMPYSGLILRQAGVGTTGHLIFLVAIVRSETDIFFIAQ